MGLEQNWNAGGQGSNFTWQYAMIQTQGQVLALLQNLVTASGAWIKEVPAGVINGVNTVFTLQNTPVSGTDMVFLSGQLQAGGGVDYTLSGKTITFKIAPNIGEQLFVFYQKA